MVGIQTLPTSHPFPFPFPFPFPSTPNAHTKQNCLGPPPPRAADPKQTDDTNAEEASSVDSTGSAAAFDSRLSRVRLKYRSGTGKKAELRRAKKNSKKPSSTNSANGNASGGAMMLPPVSLKQPVSAVTGGKVEVGFTQYSERINGAVAGLGLAALVLVELGSGRGLFKYHAGPTILIQIYTVAALAGVFVKYEKERLSVWPEKPSMTTGASATPTTEED